MAVPSENLPIEGSEVEVWCASTGGWSSGFRVERVEDRVALVRRVSDGQVLPAAFPLDQVRPAEHPARWTPRR
jgi:hypothetical protein